VELDPAQASLEAVQKKYGLDRSEIDPDFGVVAIDPDHGKYAVMVEAGAAGRLTEAPEVQGPFSNPRIETMGPPEPGPSG
jgi:hypothetical protein